MENWVWKILISLGKRKIIVVQEKIQSKYNKSNSRVIGVKWLWNIDQGIMIEIGTK